MEINAANMRKIAEEAKVERVKTDLKMFIQTIEGSISRQAQKGHNFVALTIVNLKGLEKEVFAHFEAKGFKIKLSGNSSVIFYIEW